MSLDFTDEVELAALNAIQQLDADLTSGVFTPKQAQHVLGIIQTSFNGLIAGKEFINLVTELSEEIDRLPDPMTAQVYALRHPEKGMATVTVKETKLSYKVGGKLTDKAYDSTAECGEAVMKILTTLIKAGYKRGKSK